MRFQGIERDIMKIRYVYYRFGVYYPDRTRFLYSRDPIPASTPETISPSFHFISTFIRNKSLPIAFYRIHVYLRRLGELKADTVNRIFVVRKPAIPKMNVLALTSRTSLGYCPRSRFFYRVTERYCFESWKREHLT